MYDPRLVSIPYVCMWVILFPNEYNFLDHSKLLCMQDKTIIPKIEYFVDTATTDPASEDLCRDKAM